MATKRFTPWTLLLTAAAILPGCGGQNTRPADPLLARKTLQRALDAWAAGGSAEALQKESPSLVVIDLDWRRGDTLRKYEIADGDEPHGVEHRFRVMLTTESKGRTAAKNAAYLVGTGSPMTVNRQED